MGTVSITGPSTECENKMINQACEECIAVGQGFSAEELGIDTLNGNPAAEYRVTSVDYDNPRFGPCTFCNWDAHVYPITSERF